MGKINPFLGKGFLYSMEYFFILLKRVLRVMPKSFAALDLLSFVSMRARLIFSNSASFLLKTILPPGERDVFASRISLGRSFRERLLPLAVITRRSMMCLSSRTLPGQW